MLAENKRNSIIGGVGGTLLLIAGSAMTQSSGSEVASPLLFLAGLSGVVWSCTQLAKAKGYEPIWGALAVFTYFGLLVLLFMPDRSSSESRLSARDERYLFPSDARRVTLEGQPVRADPAGFDHEFGGRFGSALAVDQFGFVRDGSISIEGSSVILAGPRHWSLIARTGALLGGTLLCIRLLGVLLGPLLALTVLHYFATSRASLELSARTIRSVRRDGRKLSFYAEDPRSNSGVRKRCIFRADCEANAIALERELESFTRAAQAGPSGPALPSNFAA